MPFPFRGIFLTQGWDLRLCIIGRFLIIEPPGKPNDYIIVHQMDILAYLTNPQPLDIEVFLVFLSFINHTAVNIPLHSVMDTERAVRLCL